MSNEIKCSAGSSVFSTAPPSRKSRGSQCSMSERKSHSPSPSLSSCSSSIRPDSLHVQHKVPAGDPPYVRAKHVQLIDKDPSKGIAGAFSTPPPPSWKSRPPLAAQCPMSERKYRSPSPSPAPSVSFSTIKLDSFHAQCKVPAGDSPYVRAKHVQLIDKDPSKAIALFWSAINAGNRVDSALKDMAVAMKQLNRPEEAIEAIKSFRHFCPSESQESLDNLLVELYKKSGRIEEEIEILMHKLKCVEEGMAFGGKKKKVGRCQRKKIQITVDQERARLLGNLGWAYLQQFNYGTAEELYRKAQALEPDNNKQCNLAICLMHMDRIPEAKAILNTIELSCKDGQWDAPFTRSFNRALQMLNELDPSSVPFSVNQSGLDSSPAPISTSQVEGDQNIKQRSFESPVSRTENWVSATLPNRAFRKAPMTEPRRGTTWYAVSDDQRTRIFGENGEPETRPVKTKEQYSLSANSKPIGYSKKSWADLVEEEEQQLSGITDTSLNKNVESFGQTEANESHGRSILSRKSSARRSLCFDNQQQETDPVEYFHWSSSKKTLDGKKQFSAAKYVPPMRRNRLRVFEDITCQPECL